MLPYVNRIFLSKEYFISPENHFFPLRHLCSTHKPHQTQSSGGSAVEITSKQSPGYKHCTYCSSLVDAKVWIAYKLWL